MRPLDYFFLLTNNPNRKERKAQHPVASLCVLTSARLTINRVSRISLSKRGKTPGLASLRTNITPFAGRAKTQKERGKKKGQSAGAG